MKAFVPLPPDLCGMCGSVCGILCAFKCLIFKAVRHVRHLPGAPAQAGAQARACPRAHLRPRIPAQAQVCRTCRTRRTRIDPPSFFSSAMPHALPHTPHIFITPFFKES
jgi:hypothetical protein